MSNNLNEIQQKILYTEFSYEMKKEYYKYFPSQSTLFEMYELRKYLRYLRHLEKSS